jgi:membrane associated rhomboid family serine protease
MHKKNKWLLKELRKQYTGIVPHQPQSKRMRPKNLPWLMPLLCCVQVAIYVYIDLCAKDAVELQEGDEKEHVIHQYCQKNGNLCNILQFNRQKKFQMWRFVTYMLTHSGIGHLIGNMVLQLLLGIPLEIYNGWWRVLVVYLAGGVAGCLGHGVLGGWLLRGASAGDYALLTAHIASVIIVSYFKISRIQTHH